MEEITFEKTEKAEQYKEPSMMKKVDEIYDALKDVKKKQIKIPRKARTKKGKLKKGYMGVIYIDENGVITGQKEKVEGGVFREKKAIRYHSTDGSEILFWLGKFPVIIQPTWRANPLNVRKIATKIEKDEKTEYLVNETYGQKYIMARMLADVIKVKTKGGKAILWILGIGILGYLAYTLFTGGF